jgi:hypothetical protein
LDHRQLLRHFITGTTEGDGACYSGIITILDGFGAHASKIGDPKKVIENVESSTEHENVL